MKSQIINLCAAIAILAVAASCKPKNLFDPIAYEKHLQETAPLSIVDALHTWNLTTGRSVSIQGNGTDGEEEKVQVLNANPTTGKAEVLAEDSVVQGRSVTLFFYAPKWMETFYAVQQNSNNTSTLKEFKAADRNVGFTGGTRLQGNPQFKWVTYSYCFEENYPDIGDLDMNDCVLRIRVEPGDDELERRINVKLAAVVATRQIAAAINIVGCSYYDVESVVTSDGQSFGQPYPLMLRFIDNTNNLQMGLHGEAVIRLFEDAHWVMNNKQHENGMGIVVQYINTRRANSDNYVLLAPKEVTYIVRFKNKSVLNNFSIESLDPFILTEFNGGIWETHTGQYRTNKILRDTGDNTSYTSIPWGLKVPMADFAYPLEENPIGLFKDNVLSGAYQVRGHAFGEWAADRNKSLDWYLFPSPMMCFE